jgi:hypothetical protein
MIIYLAHPIILCLVDLSTLIKLRNVFLTMTTSVAALFMTAIFCLVHENVYRPSHYHWLYLKSVRLCALVKTSYLSYNVFIELYGLICANTETGPSFVVTTSLQAIKR